MERLKEKKSPFGDESLTIEERLDWLLGAMTVEEKLQRPGEAARNSLERDRRPGHGDSHGGNAVWRQCAGRQAEYDVVSIGWAAAGYRRLRYHKRRQDVPLL